MLKKMDESDHYLFKAYDSTSKSEAKKFAKKALELWPQNFDAENVFTKYKTNRKKVKDV